MTQVETRRRGRARLLERTALLGPGVAYALAFLLVPLGLIIVTAFLTPSRFGSSQRPFTLDNLERLTEPVFRNVILTSIRLALIATVFALLIGYPAAMALAKLPRRWRTVAIIAIVLPFWTNLLIRMYAWIVLLNNEGLINKILRSVGLVDSPTELMNNQPAIVLGFVYAYLPLMILPLYASIERIDLTLVEASRDLYANGWQTFRRVLLPLSMPGVIAGSILVFVPSLGAYVTPAILGGAKDTLLGSYIVVQFLTARDWPFGAALSSVLMVIMLTATLVYFRSGGKNL